MPLVKFNLERVRRMKKDAKVLVRWLPLMPSSLMVFETGPTGAADPETGEVRAGDQPIYVVYGVLAGSLQ